jgi:hypothetical protein
MEPQPEKVGVLFFIVTTCSGKALGSSPFLEQAFLFFIGTTCSPNGSVRRLSLLNPSLKKLEFFVYRSDAVRAKLSGRRLFIGKHVLLNRFYLYQYYKLRGNRELNINEVFK